MAGREGQGGLRQRVRQAARLSALGLGLLAPVCANPAPPAAGPQARRLQAPPPVPAYAHILVEPLGFRAPNRFYLSYRVPSATLDFIDDSHVLFTFHEAKLMHREEREPAEDEDQSIAAVVLELPSGKVVERTSWRLHDKGRYLWALGHGRFLERERNTLYLLDRKAGPEFLSKREPYLRSEGELVSVQFSPDRRRMVVEFRQTEQGQRDADQPTLGDVAPRRSHRIRLVVVDTEAGTIEKNANLNEVAALPLIGSGYLALQQGKGKQWKVSLTPFGGESRPVTELTSNCQPSLQALSQHAFMAELCVPMTTDHLMQAYSVDDGKKLWEQQWEGRYVWGSFEYAENGSRFAYESIELDHPIATLDPVDENAMTGQPVGVFDVADGGLRLVTSAQPIMSAGQNYALSSDGERFAVLRDGAIEVFKLPPAAVR